MFLVESPRLRLRIDLYPKSGHPPKLTICGFKEVMLSEITYTSMGVG
jgi:hypothetical protein